MVHRVPHSLRRELLTLSGGLERLTASIRKIPSTQQPNGGADGNGERAGCLRWKELTKVEGGGKVSPHKNETNSASYNMDFNMYHLALHVSIGITK